MGSSTGYEFEYFDVGLRERFVGRSIVRLDGETIVLDNGDSVRFEGFGDCCAWADAQVDINSFVKSENVITSVSAGSSEENETVEWFLLADMDQVLRITGDANYGSGYYSVGVRIIVEP